MAEAAATVAVLVLAAGRSSRTAPAHKLLAPDATGQTMLARTVNTALLSRAAHIIVVVPPNQPDLHHLVQTALPTDPRLHSCTAHNAAQGLSASLKAGVAYAENLGAQAVLVCLGDMPLVSATLMNALIATQALVPPPLPQRQSLQAAPATRLFGTIANLQHLKPLKATRAAVPF
ncbi:molybdopterin biosynthesis enzyme [Acetobacter orientalis]|uniref:Molybdopterin biosynthesis enzyme n=1 Tax=Acetobacter orientalis TaxID=146474 RepID=A0A2Z5ZJD6_9PROT|nr:molybdopterin biosynthesis enzyme [Acetobacter orientalis]